MTHVIGGDWQLRNQVLGPDARPPVPDAMDDEFNDESFDTSKWTWLAQGGTTVNETNHRLTLMLRENSNRIRGIYQSTPSGDWTIQAKVYEPMLDVAGGSGGSCLFVGQSTTQEIRSANIWNRQWRGISFATPSSSGGSLGTNTNRISGVAYFEADWVDSTTTLTLKYSADGYGFAQIDSTSLAYTPAIVGLGITNAQNVLGVFDFGWFRRTA